MIKIDLSPPPPPVLTKIVSKLLLIIQIATSVLLKFFLLLIVVLYAFLCLTTFGLIYLFSKCKILEYRSFFLVFIILDISLFIM